MPISKLGFQVPSLSPEWPLTSSACDKAFNGSSVLSPARVPIPSVVLRRLHPRHPAENQLWLPCSLRSDLSCPRRGLSQHQASSRLLGYPSPSLPVHTQGGRDHREPSPVSSLEAILPLPLDPHNPLLGLLHLVGCLVPSEWTPGFLYQRHPTKADMGPSKAEPLLDSLSFLRTPHATLTLGLPPPGGEPAPRRQTPAPTPQPLPGETRAPCESAGGIPSLSFLRFLFSLLLSGL